LGLRGLPLIGCVSIIFAPLASINFISSNRFNRWSNKVAKSCPSTIAVANSFGVSKGKQLLRASGLSVATHYIDIWLATSREIFRQ
jgi:hypothetical protein